MYLNVILSIPNSSKRYSCCHVGFVFNKLYDFYSKDTFETFRKDQRYVLKYLQIPSKINQNWDELFLTMAIIGYSNLRFLSDLVETYSTLLL